MGLCELPRNWVATDEEGGLGGTCILRGCVPKKVQPATGAILQQCKMRITYNQAVACWHALASHASCTLWLGGTCNLRGCMLKKVQPATLGLQKRQTRMPKIADQLKSNCCCL